MSNLPKLKQTAEIVPISPELLTIADTYLRCNSIEDTASALSVPRDRVVQILNQREVKQYIDTVYMDYGFRNRFKLAGALDKLIEKKMQELEEADIGSSKDIADLIHLAHKMRMDELAAEAKVLEARSKHDSIKQQVNVQINEGLPTGNYGELIAKLLSK